MMNLSGESGTCLGPGCRIADLCEEDKSKVAHLIRQVSKLNTELKELELSKQTDASNFRKELQTLQDQVKKEQEEKSNVKEKFSILQKEYQIKSRNLENVCVENKCQAKFIACLKSKIQKVQLKPEKEEFPSVPKPITTENNDFFTILNEEISSHEKIFTTEMALSLLDQNNLRAKIRLKLETCALNQLRKLQKETVSVVQEHLNQRGQARNESETQTDNLSPKVNLGSSSSSPGPRSFVVEREKVRPQQRNLFDLIEEIDRDERFQFK